MKFAYWTSLKNGTVYFNGTFKVDQDIWHRTDDMKDITPW